MARVLVIDGGLTAATPAHRLALLAGIGSVRAGRAPAHDTGPSTG